MRPDNRANEILDADSKVERRRLLDETDPAIRPDVERLVRDEWARKRNHCMSGWRHAWLYQGEIYTIGGRQNG